MKVLRRAWTGALIGAVVAVLWEAVLFRIATLRSPSADPNPAIAWMLGAYMGVVFAAPFMALGGAVSGLITARVDARRTIRACLLGALIAAALTMAWAGARNELLTSALRPASWTASGRPPGVGQAIRFTAQHAVPLTAAAGSVAGALFALWTRNRRTTTRGL